MTKMALPELTYSGYVGSIEVSIEDACLHGRILFIDDLVTYEGENVPEVRAAFQDAVNRYLAHCQRVGKSASKPYSGTFNVRVGSDLHSKAAKVAHLKKIKLNEFVKQAIQAAIDMDGVVTHRHQHDVNVNFQGLDESSKRHVASVSGESIWEKASVH
jgi:predicted HicB family RNase H-like nuclease